MYLIDNIIINFLAEFGLNDNDIDQIFSGTVHIIGSNQPASTCLLMKPEDNIPYVELEMNTSGLREAHRRTGGGVLMNIYKYNFSVSYLINGCKLRIDIVDYVTDNIRNNETISGALKDDLNKCLNTMLLPYKPETDLITYNADNSQLLSFLQSVRKFNEEKLAEYIYIYEGNKIVLSEYTTDEAITRGWNVNTKNWLLSLNPENRSRWSEALSKGFKDNH